MSDKNVTSSDKKNEFSYLDKKYLDVGISKFDLDQKHIGRLYAATNIKNKYIQPANARTKKHFFEELKKHPELFNKPLTLGLDGGSTPSILEKFSLNHKDRDFLNQGEEEIINNDLLDENDFPDENDLPDIADFISINR